MHQKTALQKNLSNHPNIRIFNPRPPTSLHPSNLKDLNDTFEAMTRRVASDSSHD